MMSGLIHKGYLNRRNSAILYPNNSIAHKLHKFCEIRENKRKIMRKKYANIY